MTLSNYPWLEDGTQYWYLSQAVAYWKLFRNDYEDKINIAKGNVYCAEFETNGDASRQRLAYSHMNKLKSKVNVRVGR